jgi:hypothetical protein
VITRPGQQRLAGKPEREAHDGVPSFALAQLKPNVLLIVSDDWTRILGVEQ